MSHAKCLLAAAACLMLAGCTSPSITLQDLYGASPPANVKVVHYQADTLGMDPSFAWELAPIDDAYLKTLVKAKKLKAAAAGGRPAGANYHWPKWWDTERIEALPEVYFDDSEGLRRVWVDRRSDRL